MKIEFTSKEESKAEQEKAFLALTPVQRFYSYLDLMYRLRDFTPKLPREERDNFIIVLKSM